jgi:enoyl-CoA hydratase/carnithine racemase
LPRFIAAERRDGGVELIRLNRPPLNALSVELLGELAEHVEALATDAGLKAVVLTGTAEAFSAGAEVSQLQGRGDAGDGDDGDDGADGDDLLGSFRRALDGLAAIPRPVIAAVSGYALGGGLETALACDLRLASESARLGVPEILLGVFPGAGATQRLPRLVGPARAKEMIWSGRRIRAEEALTLGLVDRVVPVDGYLEAALEWAARLGRGPVVAMGLSKRAVDGGLDRPLDQGLDLERELVREALATEDAATGIRSFLEHGPGQVTFAGR